MYPSAVTREVDVHVCAWDWVVGTRIGLASVDLYESAEFADRVGEIAAAESLRLIADSMI